MGVNSTSYLKMREVLTKLDDYNAIYNTNVHIWRLRGPLGESFGRVFIIKLIE